MTIDITENLTGLSSFLVSVHLLQQDIASQAERDAKKQQMRFISYVVNNDILCAKIILIHCKEHFGLTSLDLTSYHLPETIRTLLNAETVRRHHIVPLKQSERTLFVGISDPTDRPGLDAAAFYTGMNIRPILVAEDQLMRLIELYYAEKTEKLEWVFPADITLEGNTLDNDESVIRFVDHLIQHALQQSASDIHIEPHASICRIRYRLSGIMYETAEIPSNLYLRTITRLKVMAKLDIAEKRLPQDGRLQWNNVDIRLSTCPAFFGEKIVLRLLDSKQVSLDIHSLGMTASQIDIFLKYIQRPQGLILVTGPTGSGKSVTLYSALQYLNTMDKNISTIEDPVEIQLAGVNQVQVNSKIGLNFATALRSFLRQDPDIMMVGEIRDSETADIVTHAAQTGHLVFSTLHTNNALEAVNRLQMMGVAAYNVVHSATLIVAQRLVRKLCVQCRKAEKLSVMQRELLKLPVDDEERFIYRAAGCLHCVEGYLGRIGVYELLEMRAAVREAVVMNVSGLPLQEIVEKEGHRFLRDEGIRLVMEGVTSLVEAQRVVLW